MAETAKVLLDKQPSWFFPISSVILLAILLVVLFWVFRGAKRYHDAVGKENQLISLLAERNQLQNESKSQQNICDQLSVVIGNSKAFVDMLNEYRRENINTRRAPTSLVQSIIESLATDIKTVVGEKHRCGFWVDVNNGGYLTLVNASAGFPSNYLHSRTLDINHSIAGRSYRKKQAFNIADVTKDPDWLQSNQPSSYTSLICAPVDGWGVVTIDAKQPLTENALQICELYSSIIQAVLDEAFLPPSLSDESEEVYEEVASSSV